MILGRDVQVQWEVLTFMSISNQLQGGCRIREIDVSEQTVERLKIARIKDR
jgi:hypothetical protein